MKNLRSDILIVFLAFTVLNVSTVAVNAQKAEKEISREYTISEGYSLGISNKYGEINLVNWDRDHLSVEILITAEASSQSKSEDLLKAIDIDITEKRSEVNFVTTFDAKRIGGNNKVNIVYKVKAPAYINVNLEQSYGNVFVQEITGIAEVNLKYGNLTANSLSVTGTEAWNSLVLAYGKASVDNVNSMNINVQYSDLSIGGSDALNIESAYSKFSLGKVVDLDIQSKYDKLSIDMLEGSLGVDSDYTQITVGTIANQFKAINVEMTYGNFKGGLSQNSAFKIDARTEYGSVKIPEGDYQHSREGIREKITGNFGGASQSLIQAEIRYGNMILK